MYIDTTSHTSRAKFYNSVEWRHLRQEILERDHWECQWCKEAGRVTTRDSVLEVDHIKTLEEHPELAMDKDNMRTLCKDCHNKRHGRMNYDTSHTVKKKHNRWESDERWD